MRKTRRRIKISARRIMALQIYISQNENDKVGVVGNYYARVNNSKPIGIEELAALIHEHNTAY